MVNGCEEKREWVEGEVGMMHLGRSKFSAPRVTSTGANGQCNTVVQSLVLRDISPNKEW